MKESKIFNNIYRVTEQFIQGRSFQEHTATEFLEKLGFPRQHKEIFKEVLELLVEKDVLVKKGSRYRRKETQDDTVSGIIRVHSRGFGFVKPDEPSDFLQDIFIPKQLTMNAVDGDHVKVRANPVISDKGPEGRVLHILERARRHIAGIIMEVHWKGDIYAYAPLLGSEQRIVVEAPEDRKLKVGDRIVMEVLEWGSGSTETICKMSSYLGHISDPSVDTQAAVEEFQIRSEFPQAVLEDAARFNSVVSQKEIQKRDDFRDLECVTIDPDTARDFDDAITLTKDTKGNYHLGVHIADVSHFVQPGSDLDDEARKRCNSTYFPGYCVPMLPKQLSDDLCSLKPNVNRLVVSVLMTINSKGDVLEHKMTRGVIRSKKRFTYKEALQVLEGKKKSAHKELLDRMVELCHVLKKKRYERGSIEFSIPEAVVIVDENGMPQKTEIVLYDITHQMIEEFMLKANEMVATHLSGLGRELAFRVHEEPSEENLEAFARLCQSFGFDIPDQPNAQDLQEVFDEALQTSYGQYLAIAYIRSLRLAAYSPHNIGHYGLSLEHYCHFTSPIRRYVDLVIHRVLFGEDIPVDELKAISDRCSEQERISGKAEQNVVLLKKLRLLHQMQEADPNKQYEAVVTRVKPFGVYFELLGYLVEGFLHVSELDNDYYIYDEQENVLEGERTGNRFFSGERITVMLSSVDLILLESSWQPVSDRLQKKRKTRQTRKQHEPGEKEKNQRKRQKSRKPRKDRGPHKKDQEQDKPQNDQEEQKPKSRRRKKR